MAYVRNPTTGEVTFETEENPSASPNGTGTPGATNLVDRFRSGFKDTPYFNSPAFQEYINKFTADPGNALQNEGNTQGWINNIKGYGDTFRQIFNNYVGRDPNEGEFSQFFSSVVMPKYPHSLDTTNLRQETTGLIDQFYRRTAEDEAVNRAKTEANSAVAPGSAYDTWANSYRQSISDTEKSLMDYQSRLFEKLRPQLLTSLQSQGLLNTGALNEAFAGAAKDLGEGTQNFLAGARSAADADIANRRYDIASSPSNYALQREFTAIPNLTASGQTALQNVWQGLLQQREFDQQNKMASMSQGEKPSALSQWGGLILGNMAGGWASNLGRRVA